MPNHYDPEKVELMGKLIKIEEIANFVGSGRMSYWMPVAVLGDGKLYMALEVSTAEEHDEVITLAIKKDYPFVSYYRIPRKFAHLYLGRVYFQNPQLP